MAFDADRFIAIREHRDNPTAAAADRVGDNR